MSAFPAEFIRETEGCCARSDRTGNASGGGKLSAFPAEFIRETEELLGNEASAFFTAMEEPAALALRVNPLKAAAEAAAAPYIESPVPWAADGFYLRGETKPGASIAHAAGAFYLQEASAMVSAAALDAKPGMRVLDLCAAPGGKSTQIASAMRCEGLLVCNEPEPARAKVLAANLERMGVQNACVVSAYPDALAARWAGFFDAVLCDAPCSGEGMFRRDPETRLQWNPAAPMGCAKRQAEILDSAALLVRSGGTLVYSTCTFNRAENEGTILSFLNRHPEFSAENFVLNGVGASQNGMLRIFPHRVRGDGHFCARLHKSGAADPVPVIAEKPNRDDLSLIDRLQSEICELPKPLRERIVRLGDTLISVPKEAPDLGGLRVISRGVPLVRIGKGYIEPAHPLAMAIEPERAKRVFALNDDMARRYYTGEALPCGENLRGWVLLTWKDLPVGWGKASNGQLKNHLPKGIRIRVCF